MAVLFVLLSISFTLFEISNCNNVTCDGIRVCQSNNIICNLDENCHITCNGDYSCDSVNIICPSNDNDCIINTNGAHSMQESHINTTLMNGGNLFITADGSRSMQNTTIDCPHIGDCNIYGGNGDYIFMQTSIRAQSTTNTLYIQVKSDRALFNAQILCPLNDMNKNCIINAFGSGNQMISNLHISSIQSLKNVLLICNYSTSISTNCYNSNSPPTMHCTAYFSSFCDLNLRNDYDGFECDDNYNTSLCHSNNSHSITNTINTDLILCFGWYSQCAFKSIYVCDNNKDCYIYCAGDSACRGSIFVCPDQYDCIVTLNGDDALGWGALINTTLMNTGQLCIS